MDPEKPIEDQFSKLHPCLPVNTRIGIVGGGPSGISASYALAKLGYTNVTVLEKYHSVGGMCESVEIRGKIYDLGGQVLAANSAPVIFHLARETSSELEELDSHKLALIDSSTGEYHDIKVADDYVSVISLTLELQQHLNVDLILTVRKSIELEVHDLQDKAKNLSRLGMHAVSELASDLTPQYLNDRGFKSIPKSVAYGYTASGYGFVQDMPYAYIHEFTRTSMAGKIRRFKGGYTSLWQKISESLPIEVHCNTEVLAIRRNFEGVKVDVKDYNGEVKVMDFDKIIISGSFPFKNGRIYRSPHSSSTENENETEAIDFGDLEKELFSKVQTIDYYTTALKIKGLDHLPIGFYYFAEYMEDPSKIGYPVAMQRFYADTDIFLFWSYGNSVDIKGPKVSQLAMRTVESMGGQVEEMVLQRRFKYFPHVGSQDMKEGFYDKLESELQGSRNTYYVGGLMAFELTERNSSYAMALVCKHFANKESPPILPYVKNLFPLQKNCGKKSVKGLDEVPGVKFPDLPSLDDYLNHWGTHNITQNKTLYTWINEEGAVVGQRTYKELHDNASCIAQNLLTSKKLVIKPGDRVLLVYVPGLDFIDAFFGCLRAKVLPVPVLPPDPMQRGGQALQKIENIAKSCEAVAILSTLGYHSAVRAGLVKSLILMAGKSGKCKAQWPNLPWLHTNTWIKNSKNLPVEGKVDRSEPEANDVCFLQFTSGSTGDAKGVVITHGGLIHNVKLMRKRYKSTSKTVLVSWLPQYHDMGLIGGLFTALVSGGCAILFSPMAFIKNPLMWLQILSKYQATHSAGPNFAFELVVRRLESNKERVYDLSSMIFLMVAAEPVRQKTLKKFIELTHPFGLSQEVMAPGYGLAENCVFVSCAFGEGNILVDWEGRVCCGYAVPNDADVDIRIVDPEMNEEIEATGKEGEIWISSPSAGIGYWGREELSQQTFRNELQNQPGRIYTRTGDLGRVIDGKLFITGRIKDLIIVAGRNIYSADVEKTVESSSELLRPGCCAVIGVPEETLSTKGISIPDSSDHVGLVIIAEVKDGKPVSKDVVDNIKLRVAEEHGVNVASVKLIKPRTISKTTSGKIKRFECLKQFTDGTLNAVPDPIISKKVFKRSFTTGSCRDGTTPRPQLASSPIPSPILNNREIAEFLKGVVSEQTGISIKDISVTENLVSYGIDSIGVVRAAQKLSDFLGVPVGAVDIFSASCIAELASFSENLLLKSQPEQMSNQSHVSEQEIDYYAETFMEVSMSHQLKIWFLQNLALVYVAFLLVFPAYLSLSTFMWSVSAISPLTGGILWLDYLIPLTLAPLSWIFCILSTCLCISLFGNSFLRPNYAMSPKLSIWSVDFVKWWALYKAQEVSSKILAEHLRGTVFLTYWFEMFGARIGSSVLLDTVDITDPSLVSIGDGAVIAEGALIQSHEVKNGTLSFQPIRIGRNSSIGPYAVIQKDSVVGDELDVLALQKTGTKHVIKSAKGDNLPEEPLLANAIYHLMGIYLVGLISSLSAAMLYFIYISLSKASPSPQEYAFMCSFGAFHWIPYAITAYATMFTSLSFNFYEFSLITAIVYLAHGLILSLCTSALTHFLSSTKNTKKDHFRSWLCRRIRISCHLRFAKLLSGTEAFCVYLRLLGAKIGKYCSIRAINPVSDPKMISVGDGVHLGDFSRIISGFYSSNGFTSGRIEMQANSVVGSQSVVLPGSVIQNDVILGALSVAPMNSVLQRGGVYVGSRNPIMIKNTMHSLDERIEEMDLKYKKIVGNLAANLAATTLKVKSRYFHRIGVSGKGFLKIYDNIKDWPDHKIFSPGKSYPVIVRHSNSLSADDDARIDARGAAIRILQEQTSSSDHDHSPLLDLTLKTGNAFYARTIADFATWLVCGLPAREEYVKRAPHVRDAVWSSLRNADSFTHLHYYSNISRLFRFPDGKEMYVKFKLRPYDETINEDSGKVEPIGILPPDTGAIPRDEKDTRPLLFLAEDFCNRVNKANGVSYVFQLQFRPVPNDEAKRDVALDCTKPWDETEFPYIDIGEINITENLSAEESEKLHFHPFLKCPEIDVIHASSCTQSASIDHGRSLIYEICQHLRNGQPIPEAWKIFLDQSDVKVDLSGCPMATTQAKKDEKPVTLQRNRYQTLWATLFQPLLQTVFPIFLLSLVIFAPLKYVLHLKEAHELSLQWLLPLFWVCSGYIAALSCVVAKWVLVGKKKEGETVLIWGKEVFMDTTWQALRTLVGDYFMEMTTGSVMFLIWMKLMGSNIELDEGAYVDSMGAMLNPEMVEIERGGCVGREALLFGHIYEGDGGKVKFGKIKVGEGGFVGSRAVVMPGVIVESGGNLSALSLAMKEEVIKSR
ncbi:hypothetical protein G4B88_005607 [Cannabis sativa]|uniref:Carrier domain-containing protein n=1 Tax=Cannabis sativa TaxID=3483 RepID=A0A7J6H9U5_CANSA|nr:hypothetical protein G4B88_005607 [Cannabis sativa]